MDLQIFKHDIQYILADFVDHLQTLQLASIYQNATTSKPPNLLEYYPQSLEEVEIQRFNLISEIPLRLQTPESIASWLLETNTLSRGHVVKLLTTLPTKLGNENVSSMWILESIANKICTLDVSEGFVEGLRIFLPAVGAVEAKKELIQIIEDEQTLKMLLEAYSKSHLLNSKYPLIQWRENTGNGFQLSYSLISTVTDIALLIVNLYKSLLSPDRPITVTSNDFFASVKVLMKTQQPSYTLLSKLVTDLFNAVSSGPNLVPILPFIKAPSYLFCSVIKSGWINIGFNTDTDVNLKSWVRLCRNALYIFVDPWDVNIQGCIPLQYLRPHLSDTLDTYSTIQLMPVMDKVMPYIAMIPSENKMTASNNNILGFSWSAPEEVSYHAQFIIDIIDEDLIIDKSMPTVINSPIYALPSPSSSNDNKLKFRRHVEVIAQWLEALEACSWTCRNLDNIIEIDDKMF